jgi:hypothetical protein
MALSKITILSNKVLVSVESHRNKHMIARLMTTALCQGSGMAFFETTVDEDNFLPNFLVSLLKEFVLATLSTILPINTTFTI